MTPTTITMIPTVPDLFDVFATTTLSLAPMDACQSGGRRWGCGSPAVGESAFHARGRTSVRSGRDPDAPAAAHRRTAHCWTPAWPARCDSEGASIGWTSRAGSHAIGPQLDADPRPSRRSGIMGMPTRHEAPESGLSPPMGATRRAHEEDSHG